jgi:hypothetical protein
MKLLWKALHIVLLATAALIHSGCAGTAGAGSTTTTKASGSAQMVSVGIAPTSTTLTANSAVQFTAAISGTSNTAVTWSMSGGGGTVSSSGMYAAPTTPGTATVMATSVADPSKTATASVTITGAGTSTISVGISPSNTATTTNGKVQFTAAVTGSTNTSVTWSVASGGGTVSTSGLYTAPSRAGTATVVATSVADPRSSALANVSFNPPGTVLLSASPTSISFGSVPVVGSASQVLTLRNTGNSAATVSSASLTGAGFTITGLTFPFTLAAAASQTANLTFAPSSSGTATGSVSFVSNASNSPLTVALSGSGVTTVQHTAMLSWQPSSSAVGFNVFRSTTNGGPYIRLNGTADPVPSYADSTVQSAKTYYYVVTEVGTTGMESGYSNQVTAVIPSP